jgi:histone acetyltransferase (RNA polymerase elongator complex component)
MCLYCEQDLERKVNELRVGAQKTKMQAGNSDQEMTEIREKMTALQPLAASGHPQQLVSILLNGEELHKFDSIFFEFIEAAKAAFPFDVQFTVEEGDERKNRFVFVRVIILSSFPFAFPSRSYFFFFYASNK